MKVRHTTFHDKKILKVPSFLSLLEETNKSKNKQDKLGAYLVLWNSLFPSQKTKAKAKPNPEILESYWYCHPLQQNQIKDMSSYNTRPYSSSSSSQSYAPSAPSMPESFQRQQGQRYNASSYPSADDYGRHQYQYQQEQPPYPGGYGQGSVGSSYGYSGFPPGTPPDVVRSFEMVDRDRSGFIDEYELQRALSSGYQRFNIRTIRLLMFLFKNSYDPLRIGPKEFAALWSCLGQWRGIFERYDRDRSGNIDLFELRDALYGLGYAIPPSVLKVLISKYDDGSGRKIELNFDSFVECGLIVKGLTEKFKEKDKRYVGSATFTYDEFMTTVLPFLVSYDD